MSDDSNDFFGLGAYLRAQRRLAKLSLRQMSALAGVSNPYLSQIERGLHEPSVRILRSIAEALNISAETILAQAGLLSRDEAAPSDTEFAIRHDPDLTEEQKLALLSVYRSYLAVGSSARSGGAKTPGVDSPGATAAKVGAVEGPPRAGRASARTAANRESTVASRAPSSARGASSARVGSGKQSTQ